MFFAVVSGTGVGDLPWLGRQSLRSGEALTADPEGRTAPPLAVARRGAVPDILNPRLSVVLLALLPPIPTGEVATATATGEMLTLGGNSWR